MKTRIMEIVTFNHSLKNIPISDKRAYMSKLFDMTSKFIDRIKWAAYFFDKRNDVCDNDLETDNNSEPRIFPTRHSAPANTKLIPFEDDLWRIVKSVKFRTAKSGFQKQLAQDLKRVIKLDKIVAFADKTSNLYQMDPKPYEKLLLDNITKDYKIAEENIVSEIDDEAWSIIREQKVKGKIPKFQTADAFISLKDHKPDFPHIVKCRLINPSKSHIAKVSKGILDRINLEIRRKSKLVQWKNSGEVINWYKKIKDKKTQCFVSFDIVEFYPSIRREHLLEALEFAKGFTRVPEADIRTIMHACKSILSYKDRIWRKKGNPDLFDVPIGAFHGAEICDLIGLHILHRLSATFEAGAYGLYRDDGLAVVKCKSPRLIDRMRKNIIAEMNEYGFKITIEIGQMRANFLDVSLNLSDGTFKPYRKPNSAISYIHNSSNHPIHVKRALPKMIENRLRPLSSDKEIFDQAKPDYQKALRDSRYADNLTFDATRPTRKKRHNRKRRCIYYNPPYCQSAKTNIGKAFLQLIDKHFDPDHPYRRIFNRSTIKISYSCMPNAKSIIKSHNRKILSKNDNNNKQETERNCNCHRNRECPLKGECLKTNVIYEATITANRETKLYIGSTGNSFKSRYNQHSHSFNNRNANETELSKYIWQLKDKNKEYTISWRLLRQIRSGGKTVSKICSTCNLEKLEIALARKQSLLNKRSELNSKCPHFKRLFFKCLPKNSSEKAE